MDISLVIYLLLSIVSAIFGQESRNSFILKSTCHSPNRWLYRNSSLIFCDDPNFARCPGTSHCEQIWLEKFACCGIDEERPLFPPYPYQAPAAEEDSEETRQIQLKHLTRARPLPKKRIKIVKDNRSKDGYSALRDSGGTFRLKGKPVGQGSISRLPIEHLFSSHEGPATDSDWIPQNRFSPPIETTYIEPAFNKVDLTAISETEATTALSETTPSEIVEFADFVKQLLQRKQKWKLNKASRRTTQDTTQNFGEVKTTTIAPIVSVHTTTETTIIENGWRVIDNGADRINNNQGINYTSGEDEAMKAMIRRLQPPPPFHAPKAIDIAEDPPEIHMIQDGSVQQIDIGQYKFIGSITLVQDQGRNILVDTGMSTDAEGKNRLLAKLQKYGLEPSGIHFVVTTHGHPDHAGNVNLFPDALHYAGHFAIFESTFKLTELFEHDKLSLGENIELLKTPGHTSDDISVIVKRTQAYGNVAISGDTFISKEDMDYPAMWQPLAYSELRQRDSRRKIICQVDYIVPGHGPMFQVSPDMRQKFLCDRFG